MAIKISWVASSDSQITQYAVERAPSVGGPWTRIATVDNVASGPNWDSQGGVFFVESTGSSASYFRLISIAGATEGPPSPPFRATETPIGTPDLVNVISVPVGDAGSLIALGFTHIEVWESRTYDAEPHEITAAVGAAATVLAAKSPLFTGLGGFSLSFQQNGQLRSFTFPSLLSPVTPTQIAGLINAVYPNTAGVRDGQLFLSSITVGRASSLWVISAPSVLGFDTDPHFGVDSRIPLVDGQNIYQYYDVPGDELSRYRWRFSANGAQPISKWSAITGPTNTALTGAPICIGVARFTTLDGKPDKVSLVVATPGGVVGAYTVKESTVIYEADATGYIEVPLIQGLQVMVAIEGTSVVKRFIVPTGSSFDILQALSDAPDQFQVQSPLPLLTRRSV